MQFSIGLSPINLLVSTDYQWGNLLPELSIMPEMFQIEITLIKGVIFAA
jgi:hypothetical protein